MRLPLLILLWAAALSPAFAAIVDTIQAYSQAMGKNVSNVVIRPEPEGDSALPVLYLLHGAYGSHNWDYWREAVQYQLLFFEAYFR